MNLTNNIQRVNNAYQVTYTVTNDFNVHVEGSPMSLISIKTTTISGQKSELAYQERIGEDGVFDHDFDARVYPKYITVVVNGEQPTRVDVTVALS